jgi:hypothetical protein
MTAIMEPRPIDQMDPPPLIATKGEPMPEGGPVSTIEAPVIVSLATDGTVSFEVPTITLPGSGSTSMPSYCNVIWTLMDGGAAFTSLSFTGQGMEIPAVTHPPLPVGVSILESEGLEGTPSKWKTCFKNRIQETDECVFSYTISIQATPKPSANFNPRSGPVLVSHDPTIVVTMEPID